MQIKKLAVVAGATGALALSVVTALPASADTAPRTKDLVGVGSDTLQYAGDFIADGDHLGDSGYNTATKTALIINFDAVPDANARLAYGSGGAVGLGSTFGTCAPGTGAFKGTGNANTNHTNDTVCQLNPTIVLRQGLLPVQRPNGSGDGAKALANDIKANLHNIDYSRASSSQSSAFATGTVNTITIGTEKVAMLTSTTSNMPAAGLSITQLKAIYAANTTGTNGLGGTGCVTWNEVGGTSTAAIVPLTPQQGSGTRKYFLLNTLDPTNTNQVTGNCARDVEENDPEAIDGSGDPANAIEPMSGARLNLFQGLNGYGENNTSVHGTTDLTHGLPYFQDPTCKYGDNSTTTTNGTTLAGSTAGLGSTLACGSATTAGSTLTNSKGTISVPLPLSPNVVLNTGSNAWVGTRSLYVYFKAFDLGSNVQFQTGNNQNKVREILANPCSGKAFDGTNLDTTKTGCAVAADGNTYGPGGQPFYASTAGQALISASGITASYAYSASAL